MSNTAKVLDPAFQAAGQRPGLEIWRIENFQPVPLPKSDHGKFYSGDSYILLQTTAGKGGAYHYDIHFWIGKESTQDEAGTAAIKAVELDSALGGRAIQHRELQGFESDKFLTYFKPCIIPLEGGFASGFKKPEEEKFVTRLYTCKGKRIVRIKEVPFARSSLNHDDVFILDTEKKIYQFNGANSNIQERAKALEVVQHVKDEYHGGTCDVAIVDDGKLVAESDSGDFWVLFGGFAPIGRKVSSEDDIVLDRAVGKLYSIADGTLKMEEGALSKAMLENGKCYLLDCGAEVFAWVGRVTQVEDRKAASLAAEEFVNNQNRPKSTRITRVIQGFEPQSFKSNFESWPAGTGASVSEEGRGKVAALLKQQGVDVKGGAKSAPTNEDIPPLLQGGGKLEMWCINGSAKTPVAKEDIGKFYGGDCYIILYTYHSGDRKEDYFLTCWMGKDSVEDDRLMATRLANTMSNSLKGRPVLGRVIQGKEPPQFVALFQPMVVLKGGLSSGYKKLIAGKNMADETYTSENIALIQVSTTSVHNNKVLQVDALATSLSSTDCFLLQSGSTLFSWHGNSSTFEQQEWAAKVADFLKPGIAVKHVKEGTETSAFWFALGGKQAYTSKKVAQETTRDPHLYTFSWNKGKLEVSEVFNFSQDDLLPEDIMILDTHAEVFVWVGQSTDLKEKQNAFNTGQKYIELAAASEGLSPEIPLYRVTEGNEPCFFTTYFSWDYAKATMPGNSFAKKYSLLFGGSAHGSESSGKSNHSSQSGLTQRASAIAALNSAFNPTYSGKSNQPNNIRATQRAAAMAALSSAFNPTSSQPSPPKPVRSSLGQGSQRAAAVAALSGVLKAESPARFSRSPSPVYDRRKSEEPSSAEGSQPEETVSKKNEEPNPGEEPQEPVAETNEAETEPQETVEESQEIPPEKKTPEEVESVTVSSDDDATEVKPEEAQTSDNGTSKFSYESLKSSSANPVKGIDYKRREAYLSDEEFQSVIGMSKEKFYGQPKWKQDMLKRKFDLF